MPNPENLKPWPKGVSGNPGGRPKKVLTDRAAAMLDATTFAGKALPKGVTVADMVLIGWFKKAMQGDAAARRDLLDRLEGRLAQQVDVNDIGSPRAKATNDFLEGADETVSGGDAGE